MLELGDRGLNGQLAVQEGVGPMVGLLAATLLPTMVNRPWGVLPLVMVPGRPERASASCGMVSSSPFASRRKRPSGARTSQAHVLASRSLQAEHGRVAGPQWRGEQFGQRRTRSDAGSNRCISAIRRVIAPLRELPQHALAQPCLDPGHAGGQQGVRRDCKGLGLGQLGQQGLDQRRGLLRVERVAAVSSARWVLASSAGSLGKAASSKGRAVSISAS